MDTPSTAPTSMPTTSSAPSSAPQSGNSSSGNSNNTSSNAPQQTGQQSGQQSGGSKPQSSQPSETFDVKVNGRTIKMTRQELIDHASMSHAAQSKFEEAATIRKQVDKIVKTAKSNPIEALMDPALGLTKDQIRDAFETWYSKEYIEPESLTAEQRKLKEYEERIKKFEDGEKEKKQREEQDAHEKLTTQQREYLQNQIVEALESSGLPRTKFFASRMAFYMRQNMLNGWEAPIGVIVKQVKAERQGMMSDLVQSSDAKTLIGLLGDEIINKIRKHDLEELRNRRQAQAPSFGSRPNVPDTNEKISSSEVNRRLREMRSGKW